MERLDGKKIIVTGGTSGMGQMVVEGYAKLGAKVVFFGRNVEAGKQLKKSVELNLSSVKYSMKTK